MAMILMLFHNALMVNECRGAKSENRAIVTGGRSMRFKRVVVTRFSLNIRTIVGSRSFL